MLLMLRCYNEALTIRVQAMYIYSKVRSSAKTHLRNRIQVFGALETQGGKNGDVV